MTIALDCDEGELERLIGSFAEYQVGLNRFAQAALGRYLHDLPGGVVNEKTEAVTNRDD